MKLYIGIDLGGTNIAVGAVSDDGKILSQKSCPTDSARGYAAVIRDMAKLAEGAAADAGFAKNEIKGIGIGCPGTVDNKSGLIVYACNVDMKNVPAADEMHKYFPNVPVVLENDANAAALAEYSVSGNGADSFIAVTLGTGVGGGIILNGKIYHGFNGVGGEIGHFTLVHDGIECACGKRGCWETYASVSALVHQTEDAIAAQPSGLMAKIAEKDGKVNGKTAFTAAKQGDKAAQDVVEKYLTYVADGITSIVNIFQPEKLVIGGGISREGEYLLAPIREFLRKYDYNKYLTKTELGIASLFNDAGIIGAALAAKSAELK